MDDYFAMRTARHSAIHGVKAVRAKTRDGARVVMTPCSYLRSGDRTAKFQQGCFTWWWAALMYNGMKIKNCVDVLEHKRPHQSRSSVAEGAIVTHIIRKNGRLKLPCSEPHNLICAPVIGPFLLHQVYASWFEATRSGLVCRPWLVLGTKGALYPRALWCDVNGSLSFISLQIGGTFHYSHVRVVSTMDEGTAQSCVPCARALGRMSSV
jgi:hypothetical protein